MTRIANDLEKNVNIGIIFRKSLRVSNCWAATLWGETNNNISKRWSISAFLIFKSPPLAVRPEVIAYIRREKTLALNWAKNMPLYLAAGVRFGVRGMLRGSSCEYEVLVSEGDTKGHQNTEVSPYFWIHIWTRENETCRAHFRHGT